MLAITCGNRSLLYTSCTRLRHTRVPCSGLTKFTAQSIIHWSVQKIRNINNLFMFVLLRINLDIDEKIAQTKISFCSEFHWIKLSSTV
jgi:hypothetical protein